MRLAGLMRVNTFLYVYGTTYGRGFVLAHYLCCVNQMSSLKVYHSKLQSFYHEHVVKLAHMESC